MAEVDPSVVRDCCNEYFELSERLAKLVVAFSFNKTTGVYDAPPTYLGEREQAMARAKTIVTTLTRAANEWGIYEDCLVDVLMSLINDCYEGSPYCGNNAMRADAVVTVVRRLQALAEIELGERQAAGNGAKADRAVDPSPAVAAKNGGNPINDVICLIHRAMHFFESHVSSCADHELALHPERDPINRSGRIRMSVTTTDKNCRESFSNLSDIAPLWDKQAPQRCYVIQRAAALFQPFHFCGRYESSAIAAAVVFVDSLLNAVTIFYNDSEKTWATGDAYNVALGRQRERHRDSWQEWESLRDKFDSELSRLLGQVDCEAARLNQERLAPPQPTAPTQIDQKVTALRSADPGSGAPTAEQVVRLVSRLRAVSTYPRNAFVKTTASDAEKRQAQGVFDTWQKELDSLTDEALDHCSELLAGVGPGIGTGIREWQRRCTTPHGREHNPFDDDLLATVIDEAIAIGRLTRNTPPPAAQTQEDREVKAKPSKPKGRLRKEDGEAKRMSMLATIRQHPSLKDDPAELAGMVKVSESTVRRWLDDEVQKYRESKAANPDPAEE